ncbi:SDR family NAD(P)-dependent oxidoreductase [Streptomyces sp. NPDC003362]
MSSVRGKVAVITGAASGIGRAVALELARRGASIAVSDVDPIGLQETTDKAAALGTRVHQQLLDVSDAVAFETYAHTVAEHFGVVHQIYNNAGIGAGRAFLDSELRDYELVLGINLWGVIHGTKAFLPHLITSGEGHVINVSSLNGYMAQPDHGPYVTSKFAIRGFTETLRIEMAFANHPVTVTCVHPGGIKTNIAVNAIAAAESEGLEPSAADRARAKVINDKVLKMDPAKAARIIVDGVEAKSPRILVGTDAKITDLLVRLMPRRYTRLVVTLNRRLLAP